MPLPRLALVLLLTSTAGAAAAEPIARVDNPQTTLELYAESGTAVPGAPLWVAARFVPAEGWHTYWRNYGDSGKPPQFDWRLPQGWKASEPLYPLPERIPVGPLMNYGYHAPQSLLIALTPPADAAEGPAEIGLRADWLVCEEICIPEDGSAAFTLAVASEPGPPRDPAVFEEARAALPQPSPWQATAEASGQAFRIRLAMTGEEAALARDAYFFPATDGAVDYARPQTLSLDEEGLALLAPRPDYAPALERVEGVVVVENGAGQREGFEVAADVAAAPTLTLADASGTGVGLGLLEAVIFALIGGVILNLMPCVFPVLSLKAFGLIRAHGGGESAARRDGLAYTAGILASFVAVAGVFLLLRGAGAQIGWGFQLQSPPVIAALSLLIFVIGLNLAGMFEIGGRLAGIGQGLTEKSGTAGSFFTGVLATVVATPCTAPFMGAALGFAIFQPAPVAFAVFAALGFGLALPYLVVAFVPPARRLLPKPGPWMATFRQALAFPMLLTAAWLVWVLAQQAGPDAVALVLAAMIAAAFLIWLWQAAARFGTPGRVSAAAVGLALAFAFGHAGEETLVPVAGAGETRGESGFKAVLGVEPWSRERVDSLRAEGRPVFVYFTAAWCITCKVNERVALADADVIEAVGRGRVAVLEGDWTNQNAEIAALLERFGRSGVPLYLFYRPGAAEAEVLPQVLLPETLLERFSALEIAGAGAER